MNARYLRENVAAVIAVAAIVVGGAFAVFMPSAPAHAGGLGGGGVSTNTQPAAATSASFSGPVTYNCEALTYAATVNIDFSTKPCKTLTLTGVITLTTSNLAAGRNVVLYITSDSSERNITFPAWSFADGVSPASLSPGMLTRIEMFSSATADASVVAKISQSSTSTSVNGLKNLFLGSESGTKTTTGTVNTFVGNRAGHENVSGQENTCVGQGACYQQTGSTLTAMGYHAALNDGDTSGSTCLGDSACEFPSGVVTTAVRNNAVGFQAFRGGAVNAANDNNTVGYLSMATITTGDANQAMGSNALGGITSGSQNIAIGHNALLAQATNDNAIGIGKGALQVATADENVGVGSNGFLGVTTGNHNTCIGFQCGFGVDGTNKVTTGAGNTFLGYESTTSANGAANQTAVGNGAISTADNSVKLGNTSITLLNVGNGHILHYVAPTSYTSGTCTSETGTGTEAWGTITATCNNQTAIVLFTTTYASTPICILTPMNALAATNQATTTYTVATTGVTITQTANIGAEQWAFQCSE